jgi:hypothetical protein
MRVAASGFGALRDASRSSGDDDYDMLADDNVVGRVYEDAASAMPALPLTILDVVGWFNVCRSYPESSATPTVA